MKFDSMVDAVGRTPLVRLRSAAPGVEVYAKLELQNLFAMKDRVARSMLLEARRTGVLREGAPIVESSSGTMALGVALVGTALGHPVHIVTDPRIDAITLAKLRALGCEVHVVAAMTSHGWQSARLEELERLMAGLPGAFWPQQYSNPDNPGAYRLLAEEIEEDLGAVDVLVGSVGSGGSLCGTARALRRAYPQLRVVGVDSVGSVLFGQPDVPGRLQSGLGNSLLPKNLDRRVVDEVHWLNDREAFESTRALAREQQVFAGNTSGSVYRVLMHVASQAAPGTRIVGILPDRGDRYVDTVYDDEFWARKELASLEAREAPEAVPLDRVVRGWSVAALREHPEPPGGHLLFVESNTTGTGMLALSVARRLGFEPVLLTGSPARYAGLDETGCRVIVCDTNSQAELRRTVQDAFRRDELAGVTTTSDFYVPAVAELTTWLGMPGNRADAVAVCRNKALLRERLREHGVPQPEFVAVTDVAEVPAALASVGLPCVVKPADDSGSNNVLLCHSEEEALAQARAILGIRFNMRDLPTAGTVLIEEYVDAPEFSVEMFTWDGETRCVGITEKSVTGLPHFVEYRHVFPAPLSPARAAAVEGSVRRAVTAAGITLGATHTEVRLTADGPVIIEINPRLAGGMIPELIQLATGVQLLDQQVRVAAGLPPEPLREPVRHAGIHFLLTDRTGKLAELSGTGQARAIDGVDRVTVTARPGAEVRPPRNAYDRLGHVIAHGDTHEQVTKILAEAVGRTAVVLEGDEATEGHAQ
ncbi:pyridoxal-phosphate dependent enzyme [Streptomyces acidiscabies]|uniref:Pyridoxal-phosphate dependent enzyme n=1 Tax=Streptomyces acidiscabies TaxID=42234 RepID=A0AAP6B4M6_9ACTN|nr:pyridoxal-phosphate dependent enzyme [Streptomyces acidiscabies]MBP5941318.1 pyridoxal-phosphate dependent enzyme [Streptomyces sp. LBUM 1476]MBZ3912668.1 pyridoxal-phosphate dependent enzyme [Streptomyces acidiscabies]MDX2958151.1 pyridoxal-phosphate dependent enzyme [Streptomyces acidiscabies]MDX3018518.1 pyridoxal-phosphate dependent enzyme [Streptomyces acidiscabies]MDX3791179.1 pyridoxal-phosphate dependent enzyme [Streptomyces acidiscabies]